MFVAKIEGGRVKLYDAKTGNIKRTLPVANPVNAVVQGDMVSVTLNNGRVQIYDANTGNIKRTI